MERQTASGMAEKYHAVVNADDRIALALHRFRAKCEFKPATGCVIWTGGTTSGRGHSSPYGSFWFEGRRWFAHRWAAKFIHGHDIRGFQVHHHCPAFCRPDTLCVEHVRAVTGEENRMEQTRAERQYWLLVQKGYEEPPPGDPIRHDGVPFFTPPAWLEATSASPFEPPF